jgi:hypothetical protein
MLVLHFPKSAGDVLTDGEGISAAGQYAPMADFIQQSDCYAVSFIPHECSFTSSSESRLTPCRDGIFRASSIVQSALPERI